jgi:hypothetical protein
MNYAIKADVRDPVAETLIFTAQKTMYAGKRIATGDVIFIFASEKEGGKGLIAQGLVIAAEAVPRDAGVESQTPRVNITIKKTASAKQSLGCIELKPFTDWGDGAPQAELNFKLYRQATNKVVGLSKRAAQFLRTLF